MLENIDISSIRTAGAPQQDAAKNVSSLIPVHGHAKEIWTSPWMHDWEENI